MKRFFAAIKRSGQLELAAGVLAGMIVAAAGLFWYHQHESSVAVDVRAVSQAPAQPAAKPPRFAHVGAVKISPEARFIADWAADSDDAGGMPFVIIDKKRAHVYVFDGDARLLDSSPVLLGSAAGDDTAPGVGDKPLSQVKAEERTTPAGRFVGERGHNARGEDVVWVDYDAAVSMHRVLTTNAAERRAERLATPTIDDNRVSFGCVNVPVAFYEKFIRPTFAERKAIIYVLPDTKPLQQVFHNAYDVAAAHSIPRS
jgi:hypothetical protein